MRRARQSSSSSLTARLRSFLPASLGRLFGRKNQTPEGEGTDAKASDGDEDIGPKDFKYWFNRYWRRVGGGSLSVSVGIHLVALIIAIFIITSRGHELEVDFLPGGGSKGSQEASAEVARQVHSKHLTRPVPRKLVVSNSSLPTIKLNDLPLDQLEMPMIPSAIAKKSDASLGMGTAGQGGGFGNGIGTGGRSGFVSLPPMFNNRCNPMSRLQKLKDSGGTPEGEAAVTKALQWLKSKQAPDGSWGGFYKCGMTGLALLCYLGHCETPDSRAYGEQVKKAVLFMIEAQRGNRYNVFSQNPALNFATYEHGIGTYAMGEMYSLSNTGNGEVFAGMVRDAFEKGVRVIIENQMLDGGWAYASGRGVSYASESNKADLPVTGWQYQALKAARYSSLNVKGLDPAIDKLVKLLEGMQTADGGYGLTNRDAAYSQWNLSGVALVGIQTLGHGKKPTLAKGVNFAIKTFIDEPPDWNKNANLYCWYYYSQAFFQKGGREWQYWNEKVLPQLLEKQTKDGNWSRESESKNIGSVSGTTSFAGQDLDIYRVALCTLMLEVYYRYLKVGDRETGSVFDRN